MRADENYRVNAFFFFFKMCKIHTKQPNICNYFVENRQSMGGKTQSYRNFTARDQRFYSGFSYKIEI